LKDRGGKMPEAGDLSLAALEGEETRRLLNCLAVFPQEMENASRDLAPHSVTTYAFNLAGYFHSFYNTSRILGEPAPIEAGRLLLVSAVKTVLTRCLALMGLSAPERM